MIDPPDGIALLREARTRVRTVEDEVRVNSAALAAVSTIVRGLSPDDRIAFSAMASVISEIWRAVGLQGLRGDPPEQGSPDEQRIRREARSAIATVVADRLAGR